jgi:Crp-like helix-turn-helix protein
MLLMLAHFGKEAVPQPVIPKISQETLAQMVGTTRSRINFFMNRLKKLGFIAYDSRSALHDLAAVVTEIIGELLAASGYRTAHTTDPSLRSAKVSPYFILLAFGNRRCSRRAEWNDSSE